MCLAVPGKILSIDDRDDIMRSGRVRFGSVIKDVCLAMVPEAGVGDYVIVHAGFAISRIDEYEADEVFNLLREAESKGAQDA